jgi:hypothetical protein
VSVKPSCVPLFLEYIQPSVPRREKVEHCVLGFS